MSTRSQRVMSVTLGWEEVVKNMLRIRCYLSKELVISLRTNGAQRWCCERSETQCSRPPEIRFETVSISSRHESPPCWRRERQFRNDCSLEDYLKCVCNEQSRIGELYLNSFHKKLDDFIVGDLATGRWQNHYCVSPSTSIVL